MIDYGFGAKLGPISRVDRGQMLKWRNSPEIYKWCRQYEPLEDWSHSKWHESLANRSDVKMYGIFDNYPQAIGVCGLTSIDHINSRAEFSLYIGPEFRGRDYGEKSLETLCAHGFYVLNLNCIWGETFEGNPAIGIFENIGFKKEGTRRQFYFREGKYIDAHLYSLLRSECDFSIYNNDDNRTDEFGNIDISNNTKYERNHHC